MNLPIQPKNLLSPRRCAFVSICSAATSMTLMALIVLVLSSAAAAAAEPIEVNRVVLRVNNRIATLHDFKLRVAARNVSIRRNPELTDAEREEQLAETPLIVLRSIWEELLVTSRADQLGLVTSEQELEEAILEQMRRFQLENVDQLRMALAQEGLTIARFRDSLAVNMLYREVMGRELFPRVRVSEDELRSIYRQRSEDFLLPEQVNVQELVVLDSADLSSSEQTELASQLRERWLAGEDPETLAEEAGDGVRLLAIGWVAPGDLASELESVVWPLSASEISEPTVARGGVHILQAVERKESSVRPFEEVREQIAGEERNRKMRTEQQKYLKELEERAYYEASPPPGLEDFRTVTGRSLEEGGLQILQDLARPDLSEDPTAAGGQSEGDPE